MWDYIIGITAIVALLLVWVYSGEPLSGRED